MKIFLDDEYIITSNPTSYTLSKYSRDKEGKLSYSSPSYWSTFEGLFKDYVRKKLGSAENIETLAEIVVEERKLYRKIDKLAEKLDIEVQTGKEPKKEEVEGIEMVLK
ncbi:MAG: hypothetical protein ACOCRO_10810 [Halanaerobiales bacterium]